jgi:hypothetical protein
VTNNRLWRRRWWGGTKLTNSHLWRWDLDNKTLIAPS